MIVSLYITEHQYLSEEPLTINFGGKYLYSYLQHNRGELIVVREENEKYIPGFFDISGSKCKIQNLSAVVGENGVGKSSILDVIRSIFIENGYGLPFNTSTILVEVNGETKVLQTNYPRIYLQTLDKSENAPIESIDKEIYQPIYYSPHFDLKYNNDSDEVDKYDISLDNFIKDDLVDIDANGPNENGFKYKPHEELIFKNSLRQIEFLNSNLFKEQPVFREVFNLPEYQKAILYFRDFEIPKFWNTPNELQPIIKTILQKIEEESSKWHIFRDQNLKLSQKENQALVNKYLLERFVMQAFMSVIINQMEKSNTWLEEGVIEDSYSMDRFKENRAFDVFSYFISKSYIRKGNLKKKIFNYEEILSFFKKLDGYFSAEKDPNYIKKNSIRIGLDEIKGILVLNRKILENLFHYYPKRKKGLLNKNDYIQGFIAFRPVDRNMSSGETALLNFYSRLFSFIQDNLTSNSKFLVDKENYILLLDEADLGFHPIWKKKFVDAILKTLPYFFEDLDVKPNLQIIATTHDPLTLSDFAINNVVFLNKLDGKCNIVKDEDKIKIKKTFGANITDLLAHSFFVDDGLIGDFSKSKINEVIHWINESKELSKDERSSGKFKVEIENYKKIINLIDEKIIKIKLAEMITDLITDNDYYNQVIDEEIKFLSNKRK